jgi:hypothetical protein
MLKLRRPLFSGCLEALTSVSPTSLSAARQGDEALPLFSATFIIKINMRNI